MRRLCAALSLTAMASAAPAEELPDFLTCMDQEVARYERAMRRFLDGPGGDFDVASPRGVDYCGSVGIVLCDRTEATIPCQLMLAAMQDVLRDAVLASVPEPEAAIPEDSDWPKQLYPRLWALAKGSSAGPDCSHTPPLLEAWCEAREANRRLQTAVLTWQFARYLGKADDAVTAGWAKPVGPLRPKARPEGNRP